MQLKLITKSLKLSFLVMLLVWGSGSILAADSGKMRIITPLPDSLKTDSSSIHAFTPDQKVRDSVRQFLLDSINYALQESLKKDSLQKAESNNSETVNKNMSSGQGSTAQQKEGLQIKSGSVPDSESEEEKASGPTVGGYILNLAIESAEHRRARTSPPRSTQAVAEKTNTSKEKESGNSSDKGGEIEDLAAVLFVVAGVVVVVGALFVGTKMALDALYGDPNSYSTQELGTLGAFSFMPRNNQEGQDLLQSSAYGYAYYNWSAMRQEWGAGFEARVGWAYNSIKYLYTELPFSYFENFLFLVGPTFSLGTLAPKAVQLSFLVGAAGYPDLSQANSFVASSDIRWRFYEKKAFRAGGYLGVLAQDLSIADGILQKDRDINTNFSLSLGFFGSFGW